MAFSYNPGLVVNIRTVWWPPNARVPLCLYKPQIKLQGVKLSLNLCVSAKNCLKCLPVIMIYDYFDFEKKRFVHI